MIVIVVILSLLLVLLAAIEPYGSNLSDFEQKRRLDSDDLEALRDCRRGNTRDYLVTWQHILTAWLIVVISALLVKEEGWLTGVLIAMVISLIYGRVAQMSVIRRFTKKYYDKSEDKFLNFAESTKKYIKPFRSLFSPAEPVFEIGSREELQHLIANSKEIVSTEERQTLLSALEFKDKQVKDYMTPKSVINVVEVGELLGPLVLDGLHKTGHSRFPVIDGDIDHIVGILHIQNLFALNNRQSMTVKEVMDNEVYYIREDFSLNKALAACLKKRRSMLVVVNEYRETVGIITMEDIIEQLIGRKIIDQFDEYDDLRVVAKTNPRGNNSPKKGEDIA